MAIADEKEILEYLTCVMRNRDDDIKFSDTFKAAELLGKYYGMFDKRGEEKTGDVIIVDNIAGKYRKKA